MKRFTVVPSFKGNCTVSTLSYYYLHSFFSSRVKSFQEPFSFCLSASCSGVKVTAGPGLIGNGIVVPVEGM